MGQSNHKYVRRYRYLVHILYLTTHLRCPKVSFCFSIKLLTDCFYHLASIIAIDASPWDRLIWCVHIDCFHKSYSIDHCFRSEIYYQPGILSCFAGVPLYKIASSSLACIFQTHSHTSEVFSRLDMTGIARRPWSNWDTLFGAVLPKNSFLNLFFAEHFVRTAAQGVYIVAAKLLTSRTTSSIALKASSAIEPNRRMLLEPISQLTVSIRLHITLIDEYSTFCRRPLRDIGPDKCAL